MRLRFAPSPTGYLHVGGARTALYNWLLARHAGGSFVLRIEDTDVSRSTDEAIRAITEDLAWLGLWWDEGPDVGGQYGPYRQTERAASHIAAARRLLAEGRAYRCFCTPKEMAARREAEQADAATVRRRHACRFLTEEEVARKLAQGRPSAIRFKVEDGATVVDDLVRGAVTFDNSAIEDFVLLRRDGTPTYNLAVVLDDAGMAISHVVRGDDHLSNTPKQLMLYAALGLAPPRFGHLPMIVGADERPLSKRFAAVSVGSYREQGYLADALINFLALLGWSLDDKTTVMDREALIQGFGLERVVSKPAAWDRDKLDWMNGVYIRALADEDLAGLVAPFLTRAGLVMDDETVIRAMPLVKERLRVLADAAPLLAFLGDTDPVPGGEARAALGAEEASRMLAASLDALEALPVFGAEEVEAALRGVAESLGLKPRAAFQAVRIATTGGKVSPPLFQSIALLGREASLRRLKRALEYTGERT